MFAILIAVSFTTAGFLHAVIPHDDTHALQDLIAQCSAIYGTGHCPNNFAPKQDAHESAVWSFIHASLAHEEKKAPLPAPMSATAAIVLALASALLSFLPLPRRRLHAYERALARGVFAYRKFG